MSYIFLKENYSEDHVTRYYAIPAEKIETLELHATYDRYGQTVGHTNAGDYSVDNEYSDADGECIEAIKERFNITAKKYGYDTPEQIDFLQIRNFEIYNDSHIDESEIENYDEKEINDFIQKWEEENANYQTVEGFDYWDGHNWRTVTTSCDFNEPSHEIIRDEDLEKELNDAIENGEFEREGFGKKIYSCGKWIIEDSYIQGTWASYEIFPADEVAIDDL